MRWLLGSEVSIAMAQKMARIFPDTSIFQRLCWHAGATAWDKTGMRFVRTQPGFGVCLDLSDHTWRGIFFYGVYEPEVTSIVSDLAAPGQVWWDIGANIGWYTFLLSRKVGENGRVLAFEPNPLCSKFLSSGLGHNGFLNVVQSQVALGAKTGRSILFVPVDPDHTLGGHGRPSLIRHEDIKSVSEITVETATVDQVIEMGMPHPYGIKLDVEGFESAVLAGAKEMFKSSPPSIIISEVTHFRDALVKPKELVQTIISYGYIAFHVENRRRYDPNVEIDGSLSKDFVFVHESCIEEIGPKLAGS